MARPIVFLTDYGLADGFVGICHGVIARLAPDARVIDLTARLIPRQDVMRGALALGVLPTSCPVTRCTSRWWNPGVGSERRSIAVLAASGAMLVGPDNGLLSMAWDVLGGTVAAAEISAEDVVLQPVSKTFHGRDVFAPAAAHLANGLPLERMGPSVDPTGLRAVELAAPMLADGVLGCRVTSVDGFGNVQLNARPSDLEEAGIGRFLRLGGRAIPHVQDLRRRAGGHARCDRGLGGLRGVGREPRERSHDARPRRGRRGRAGVDQAGTTGAVASSCRSSSRSASSGSSSR